MPTKANIYKADFAQKAVLKPVRPKQTIEEKLQERRFNPAAEPPTEQIILRIEGKNIGSLQNIITLTGLPKQGKSKFSAAIAASALSGKEVFGLHCRLPQDRPNVAYWGTDESGVDFFNTVQLIKRLSATDLTSLDAFNVRRDEPGDIVRMINTYLQKTPQCCMMIIDNIADLLMNFNDEGQSKRVINALKYWSDVHNLLLVPLIHLGKGSLTSIGHLGAGLDRYSQSIFKIEKDKERQNYSLSADRLRSAGDFTPLCIYYNTHGNGWEQTSYEAEPAQTGPQNRIPRPAELDITDHRLTVGRIFNASSELSYGELIEQMIAFYAKGRNWCKECFGHLIRENLVFNPEPGRYTNVQQRGAKLFIKS